MAKPRILDRLWRRPPAREARNEQRKSLASLVYALAVTMIAAGLIGPIINPSLGETLALWRRVALVCGGFPAHIFVRAILWTVEDK